MEQNTSGLSVQESTVQTTRQLRLLYFVRAIFACLWALLLFRVQSLPTVTIVLLIIYPAFDAVSAAYDGYIHRATHAIMAQILNGIISLLAVIAVLIALPMGVPAILRVFGVWAIITGALEFILALRRWRTHKGQAVLLFGGAVSVLGGTTFIVLAGQPTFGLGSLAGYALMGSWQFLFSAIRLGKKLQQAT